MVMDTIYIVFYGVSERGKPLMLHNTVYTGLVSVSGCEWRLFYSHVQIDCNFGSCFNFKCLCLKSVQ